MPLIDITFQYLVTQLVCFTFYLYLWKKRGCAHFVAYFAYAIVIAFITSLLLLVLFSPSGLQGNYLINSVITFLYCHFMKDYSLLKEMLKKTNRITSGNKND